MTAPVAFTLCSNNYFSMALAWADSMRATNPDYVIIIGLVDKRSALVDYESHKHIVIGVEEVNIANLQWMTTNYNIVEFNTAVKPFYFEYLFQKYFPPHVLYFDPDIFVYSSVLPVTSMFDRGDMLLTPHVNQPISRDVYPWENHFLKYGIYNLGFAGVKQGVNTKKIIDWWKERLAEHCFANSNEGLYVDQLWANFFPLFFENVVIVRHPGANVAFWNLHERTISSTNEGWKANGEPLIFFHFSSFSPRKPQLLTKENYSNFDIGKSPEVKQLASEYAAIVMNDHFESYNKIPFAYAVSVPRSQRSLDEIGARINKKERILNALIFRFIRKERLMSFMVSLFKDYAEYDTGRRGVKSESVYSIEGIRKENGALQRARNGGIVARLRAFASSIISFIR